jgi:hypothetical protein
MPTVVAQQLLQSDKQVHLIYAFNSTGKTRLSVAYKDATKKEDGSHAGVYYNAYSEDLFIWNNDNENHEQNIRLVVTPCSLNQFHALLTEDDVRDKLTPYRPKFDFTFKLHEDSERGIESVAFFLKDERDAGTPIKISRGEERIFVWCFFLALFEVEGWADRQSGHFFIDDPVSSLDDNNTFVTAATLFDLIESQFKKRKIILTTHHMGLFSLLCDWMTKGEKASKFKIREQSLVKVHLLKNAVDGALSLENPRGEVLLYHLCVLQTLEQARRDDQVAVYHFALLRQALENIASFLGVGQFGHVLHEIGIDEPAEMANIVNALSHKKIYYYESNELTPDNRIHFDSILNALQAKYNFVLHIGRP